MDLQEVGWGGLDWIYLAQDRGIWLPFVYDNEPSGSLKCGEFLDPAEGLLACQEGLCTE
jgi:hypothetical protein